MGKVIILQNKRKYRFTFFLVFCNIKWFSINSSFILSLTRKLQSGRGTSFTSNAGVDVYVWYAHKKSLGIANFVAGGFAGGFEAPVTVSFTNASGFTEDYYVYRSTNPQIGVVSIVVS